MAGQATAPNRFNGLARGKWLKPFLIRVRLDVRRKLVAMGTEGSSENACAGRRPAQAFSDDPSVPIATSFRRTSRRTRIKNGFNHFPRAKPLKRFGAVACPAIEVKPRYGSRLWDERHSLRSAGFQLAAWRISNPRAARLFASRIGGVPVERNSAIQQIANPRSSRRCDPAAFSVMRLPIVTGYPSASVMQSS